MLKVHLNAILEVCGLANSIDVARITNSLSTIKPKYDQA